MERCEEMKKRTNISDEWLYENIPTIDHNEIKELERNIGFKPNISDKSGNKTQKNINTRKSTIPCGFKKLIRVAAAIIVFSMLGVLAIGISVKANRIKLFEVIKSIYPNEIIYHYKEDIEDKMVFENPHHIPDDYMLVSQKESPYSYYIEYKNSNNEIIIWRQLYANDTLVVDFDSEYDWEEIILLEDNHIRIHGYNNGLKIAYVEKSNYIITVYADNIEISDIHEMFR